MGVEAFQKGAQPDCMNCQMKSAAFESRDVKTRLTANLINIVSLL